MTHTVRFHFKNENKIIFEITVQKLSKKQRVPFLYHVKNAVN